MDIVRLREEQTTEIVIGMARGHSAEVLKEIGRTRADCLRRFGEAAAPLGVIEEQRRALRLAEAALRLREDLDRANGCQRY